MSLQTTHYQAGLRLGQVLVLTGQWEFRPQKATILWYLNKLRGALSEVRSMLRARESVLGYLDRLEDLVLEDVFRAQEDVDGLESFEYEKAHLNLRTMREGLEDSIRQMPGSEDHLSSFRLGVNLAQVEMYVHDPTPLYAQLSECQRRREPIEVRFVWNDEDELHNLLAKLDLELDNVMPSCDEGSPIIPDLSEAQGGWEPLELGLQRIQSANGANDILSRWPNDERDAFLYREALKGRSLKELAAETRRHPSWEKLSSDQGVRRAIDRFARRHGLERVPLRKRGRPRCEREIGT